MSCEKIQDNLSAYLDGELPAKDADLLRQHLDGCPECRAMLDDLRAVAGLLSNVPPHKAPTGLAEEVQSRLERKLLLAKSDESPESAARTDRRLARRQPALWPRVAAVAACLMLVGGIAWLLTLPEKQPGRPTEVANNETSSTVTVNVAADRIADAKLGERLDRTEAVQQKSNIDGYAKLGTPSREVDNRKMDLGIDGNRRQEAPGTYGFATARTAAPGKAAAGKAAGSREPEVIGVGGGGLAGQSGKEIGATHGGAPKTGSGTSNTLVVMADADASLAMAEMDKLISKAGMTNLNRRVETRGPRYLADNFKSVAKDPVSKESKQMMNALPYDVRDNENLETIVYEGTASVEQVALLNHALALSPDLAAQPMSNGAFVAVPKTQAALRLNRRMNDVMSQTTLNGRGTADTGVLMSETEESGASAKAGNSQKLAEMTGGAAPAASPTQQQQPNSNFQWRDNSAAAAAKPATPAAAPAEAPAAAQTRPSAAAPGATQAARSPAAPAAKKSEDLTHKELESQQARPAEARPADADKPMKVAKGPAATPAPVLPLTPAPASGEREQPRSQAETAKAKEAAAVSVTGTDAKRDKVQGQPAKAGQKAEPAATDDITTFDARSGAKPTLGQFFGDAKSGAAAEGLYRRSQTEQAAPEAMHIVIQVLARRPAPNAAPNGERSGAAATKATEAERAPAAK